MTRDDLVDKRHWKITPAGISYWDPATGKWTKPEKPKANLRLEELKAKRVCHAGDSEAWPEDSYHAGSDDQPEDDE